MPHNFQNNNLHISPGKILHGLLFFTILFPFIPSIIPSTDTQPTFTLLFVLSFFYVIINIKVQKNYYNLSYEKLFIVFIILCLIIISVTVAKFFNPSPTLWTRIISFLQFTFALFFAFNSSYFIRVLTLKKVFIAFAVFSIVYFLTHGLVENLLIPGRTASFDTLAGSGRGARTLSPEPSFFALHILNLYLLFFLLATKESVKKYGTLIFWLASFCLLISLSGYGFVIFLLIFFLRYTKASLIFLLILLISSQFIVDYLNAFQGFRGISLITKVILDNPSVILNDASFVSRFGSFFAYLTSIKENFILGDGFTLFQGGGFISIVSSLGLVAAMFLILVLIEIFRLKKSSYKLKILLFFWFLINLFSGPIGIPILGVIIGLIFRKNHAVNSFNSLQAQTNE